MLLFGTHMAILILENSDKEAWSDRGFSIIGQVSLVIIIHTIILLSGIYLIIK